MQVLSFEALLKRLCEMDCTVHLSKHDDKGVYRLRIVHRDNDEDRVVAGITKFVSIASQESSVAPALALTLESMIEELERLNAAETPDA